MYNLYISTALSLKETTDLAFQDIPLEVFKAHPTVHRFDVAGTGFNATLFNASADVATAMQAQYGMLVTRNLIFDLLGTEEAIVGKNTIFDIAVKFLHQTQDDVIFEVADTPIFVRRSGKLILNAGDYILWTEERLSKFNIPYDMENLPAS